MADVICIAVKWWPLMGTCKVQGGLIAAYKIAAHKLQLLCSDGKRGSKQMVVTPAYGMQTGIADA